jgi:hypothetical protein
VDEEYEQELECVGEVKRRVGGAETYRCVEVWWVRKPAAGLEFVLELSNESDDVLTLSANLVGKYCYQTGSSLLTHPQHRLLRNVHKRSSRQRRIKFFGDEWWIRTRAYYA